MGGHLDEREELSAVGRAWLLRTAFCSDGSGAAAARCSFIPYFNMLKPFFEKAACVPRASEADNQQQAAQNSLEISSILFCFRLFMPARGGKKGSRAFSAFKHTSILQ